MGIKHRYTRRAAIAAASLALLACAGPRSAEDQPLRVACDFSNPPFASLGPDGEPVGRDVELARTLADRLDRPLVWVRAPFGELLELVETGAVELAIATIGRTPERAERVAFSTPYFETEILALVRSGEGEPQTLADLAGLRLSAGAGTTSERAAEALGLAEALVATASKDAPVAERLLAREIDAALMDGPDAIDLAREVDGLAVLAEPLAAEAYCVAVRPDRPELLAQVNRALEELGRSGWLAHLGQEPAQRTQRFLVR